MTRETLAVMLYRFFLLVGKETVGDGSAVFRDEQQIAPAAKDAVDAVSSMGILIGDVNGNFKPKALLTRAEMAVILNRLLEQHIC